MKLRVIQDRSRTVAASDTLLVAAWAALIAGLIEAARLAFVLVARDRMIFVSRDLGWMAPVGYLLLFMVPGVVLAALAALRPRLIPLGFVVFGFVTAAAFSVLLPFTKIARYASLLLAVGVGVQMARMISASPGLWRGRLRRQLVGAVGAVVLIAACTRGGIAWQERRTVAKLPAPPDGAPNVLLLILDTVRAA